MGGTDHEPYCTGFAILAKKAPQKCTVDLHLAVLQINTCEHGVVIYLRLILASPRVPNVTQPMTSAMYAGLFWTVRRRIPLILLGPSERPPAGMEALLCRRSRKTWVRALDDGWRKRNRRRDRYK